MRALLMALGLVATGAAGAAPGTSWSEDEVARFPHDYGAWSRQAWAAEAAGDPARAAAAWARAAEIAPESVEAALGRTRSALAVGADSAAREGSASAIAVAPDLAYAWRLRAESLRRPVGTESAAHAAVRAAPAAHRALELDPTDPWSRCEVAWSALRLGRAGAARRQFSAIDHACADPGRAASAGAPRAWVSSWGGLQRYPSSTQAAQSALGSVSVGGATPAGLTLDLTGRGGRLQRAADPAAPAVPWWELWGAAGWRDGWVRSEVVVGGSSTAWPAPPAPADSPPRPDLGPARSTTAAARIEAGVWPVGALTVARGWADDGRTWQVGVDGRLDLTSALTVHAGGQASAWTWTAPVVGPLIDPATLDPAVDGAPLFLGRLGVSLRGRRARAHVEGRLGQEMRPLRFDDRFTWAASRRIGPSGLAEASLAAWKSAWLSARYEALRLPAVSPALPDAAAIHALSLGLVVHLGGASR